MAVVDKFLFLFSLKMFNCLLDCDPIQMNGTTCINLSSYRYCTFLEWVHACTCTGYYDVQGGSEFFLLWMKFLSVTIQMKATEQYFPVQELIIMLYKLIITFEQPLNNTCTILKCDHSNKSYLIAVFSNPKVQGGL